MQNLDSALTACGGLGLFLLGIMLLSDGLRALAGGALNRTMVRFTRSPWSGALTGAAVTATLQSSSVTTVAAVGFVSSGLLAYPEALGIIFGANIGTTITGWMVAILGFKLKIGMLAMPILLLGVILRILKRSRISRYGTVLCGFALIFIGISLMQDGFAGMDTRLTPEQWPTDSLSGRLQLLAIGLLVTLLTQSSSAGVAATLAALYSGSINFPQAASLIIGMDIGTTITALLATIGGNSAVRRTGVSHLCYNLFGATLALLLLGPYMALWDWLAPGTLDHNGEIPLVGFHTLYNTLTALILLPFTWRFAGLMHRLIRDRDPLRNRLDPLLLHTPVAALSAAQETIRDEITILIHQVISILGERHSADTDLASLQTTLDQTRRYLDSIHFTEGDGHHWHMLLALLHTLDHLQRMHERCEEDLDRALIASRTETLQDVSRSLISGCERILAMQEQGQWTDAAAFAESLSEEVHNMVAPYRHTIVGMIADGRLDAAEGTARLEAIRWLQRVSKHVQRISDHFAETMVETGKGY